jgi:hypothetical protein
VTASSLTCHTQARGGDAGLARVGQGVNKMSHALSAVSRAEPQSYMFPV